MPVINKLPVLSIEAGRSRPFAKDKQMTILFRPVPQTHNSSRWRTFFRPVLAASLAMLVFGLIGLRLAHGQVSPLQITGLAQGYSATKTPNMHVTGPTDVLQALLVFQPGGE